MHNFKKALIASCSFLLCFALMFSVVVFPAFANDSLYNDSSKRQELAGEIDFLFSGASHALGGFIPEIIDSKLGCYSYNLSSYACSFEGRLWLLEKELKRNPVSTYVLEISHDTIRDYSNDRSTGEPMTILKLDSFSERLEYMSKYVPLTDFDKVSSVILRYGLNAWKAKIFGQTNIPQSNKGYIPNPCIDMGTTSNSIAKQLNTRELEADFNQETLAKIEALLALCNEYNCEVIVVMVPVSDQLIMEISNCDEFYSALSDYCETQNLELYDFNLLKNRSDLFSDTSSFYDSSHIAHEGAVPFSEAFADVMLMRSAGEDTASMFYSSYAELKSHIVSRYQ